ncbi:MAG: DUF1343 domain-containing protein [Bacteroidales bacterium]|nr:DUF1343 domain-containing protein [Bacteroidales bacterium]
MENNFDILRGKRVGLVTNPTGIDRNMRSTVDILYSAENVNLVALFGPEHGVRGDLHAGDYVPQNKDAKTGLPIYSLYGATRKPSDDMLKGIDVMVYDIQDNGCRSYTYISTLGLVMQACAQKGIEVVVLDRPNPLGGEKVEGSLVQDGFYSFVGMYPIPYIYGLTVGELALMINGEGYARGQNGKEPFRQCKLTVVPMEGWTRDMTFSDTGLPWVPTSPQIPTAETCFFYPATGISGELGGFLSIGVGYTLPFQLFTADWIPNADQYADRLNSLQLPGVTFRPINIQPFFGSGAGKEHRGVQIYITDYSKASLTEIQFRVMEATVKNYPGHKPFTASESSYAMFDKVLGTDYIRKTLAKECNFSAIQEFWRKDTEAFKKLSQKYYLY